MCIKKYLEHKTGEWDCQRQLEDAYIQDWCFQKPHVDPELARELIEKQEKEDKNLFRNIIWWLQDISREKVMYNSDDEESF